MSHIHRPSADPRRTGSCSCGHALALAGDFGECAPECIQAPADKAGNYEEYVERDVEHERHLTDLAARAAGFFRTGPDGTPVGDTGGLDEFADARAWSGGVRANIDADREALEELADARHYLVWGIQQVHAGYLAGDAESQDAFQRRMRALSHVIEAWHALAGSTRAAG